MVVRGRAKAESPARARIDEFIDDSSGEFRRRAPCPLRPRRALSSSPAYSTLFPPKQLSPSLQHSVRNDHSSSSAMVRPTSSLLQ